MEKYTEVMKTGDLKNGEMRGISVHEKNILVARVDDKFYATSNVCPHMRGELANGTLDGTIVTCPRHASQFDVTDGHVVRWTDWSGAKLAASKLFRAPKALQCYPVKVKVDKVLVDI